MRNTVRFWFYWSGWVKLTLAARDVPHTLYRSECTDEGFSSRAETFTLATDDMGRDVVVRETVNAGRDCDGRIEQSYLSQCTVKRLRSFTPTTSERRMGYTRLEREALTDVRCPEWREVSSRQRDYAAEAMGY